MAKPFDPLEYNYELVNIIDGVVNFQKILSAPKANIPDIIELAYYSDKGIWVFFINLDNITPFVDHNPFEGDNTIISLYIGEIKSSLEFELLMKRITKDPKLILQLGI